MSFKVVTYSIQIKIETWIVGKGDDVKDGKHCKKHNRLNFVLD